MRRPSDMSPRRRLRSPLLLTGAVTLLAALAACGADAGSDDRPMSGAIDGTSAARTATEPATADVAEAANDALSKQAKDLAPGPAMQRAVISTGVLRISARDPEEARRDALDLVALLRGTVADEQSSSDTHGRLDEVELILRIPSASFDKALDDLAELGTLRKRQQSAADVTTQVIDNDARVKAQRASVASIRRLLARATTIGEIMSIENQLSRRQAELDSLVQQQKYLADQTSMSTIRLGINRTEKEKADEDHTGFLGGLEDGWNALGASAVAIGTGLGAALPFAAVLALVGAPGWLLYRRNRRTRPHAPAEV